MTRHLAYSIQQYFSLTPPMRVEWWPVYLGGGICLYFAIPWEPPYYLHIAFLIPAFLLLMVGLRWPILHLFPIAPLLLTLTGYGMVGLHAHHHAPITLSESAGPLWLRGTVEKIDDLPGGKGLRLFLTQNDLWTKKTGNWPQEKTPTRIRLNIRTGTPDSLTPGQSISAKVMLRPPPRLPLWPGGYDFARMAWFNGIGAVGYSLSPVRIRTQENTSPSLVEHWRHTINRNISNTIQSPDISAIAKALLTGTRGGISKSDAESIRVAGLGHLLAISGLHMGLVMAGAFLFIRLIWACIPRLTLSSDGKFLAAITAMLTGAAYLLLSGMPVSASRAYVMMALLFLAVLLRRIPTPLRSVSIAAFILLILSPYALVTPGFQMSFAAVTALIGSVVSFRNWHMTRKEHHGILIRITLYLFGILSASIIAGLATTPYALHHFGRITTYGTLSNIIAIPLVTFIILPMGIISVLLMPLGLEGWALQIMEWGIGGLLHISHAVATWPDAILYLPASSGWALGILTFGALMILLSIGYWRWLGFILVLSGTVFMLTPAKGPDIIVSSEAPLFAVRMPSGELAFSSYRKGQYARDVWLEANGQETPHHIRDYPGDDAMPSLTCTDHYCDYTTPHHTARIVTAPLSGTEPMNCNHLTYLIMLTSATPPCRSNAQIIYYTALQHAGTHLFWLGETPHFTSILASQGVRLWTGAGHLQ